MLLVASGEWRGGGGYASKMREGSFCRVQAQIHEQIRSLVRAQLYADAGLTVQEHIAIAAAAFGVCEAADDNRNIEQRGQGIAGRFADGERDGLCWRDRRGIRMQVE